MKFFLPVGTIVLVLSTSIGVPGCAAPPEPRWDASEPDVRARFVDALQEVRFSWLGDSDMDEDDVLDVLGPPHDIITHESAGWIQTRANEIWCYGTDGHLTYPTLGTVTFLESGRIEDVAGKTGTPPSRELFEETELRELLRSIHRGPHEFIFTPSINSRELVRLVNELRLLGKEKALAAIAEYVRTQSSPIGFNDGAGVGWLMRFLFDVPSGMLHPTTYTPCEEYQTVEWPAFPTTIIGGAPFVLHPVELVAYMGPGPNVAMLIEWYRLHGIMRSEPLRPIDDPILIWEEWQKALRQVFAANNAEHALAADKLVQEQLLGLVESVCPPDDEIDCSMCSYAIDTGDRWSRVAAELEHIPTRWDSTLNRYVRSDDGSYFDPPPRTRYRNAVWRLPVKGRIARLTITRMCGKDVRVGFDMDSRGAKPLPYMMIHVFDVAKPREPLAKIQFHGSSVGGSSGLGSYLDLPPGTVLRASLIHEGRVIAESDDLLLEVPDV